VFIFFGLVFVAGIRKRYILSLLGTASIMFPVFWYFLKDYQKERLLVFINPNIDPLGAGYTVIQSKIAVGSGGLFGRGWLSGTQNTLNFLPERHTDFIFSCFAESCGFFGAVVLLFLFYLLFKECINVIYATRDPFARLLVVGITIGIFLQVIINVSMTIGLMPVVGLPLPLLSYGGTSMLVTFMSVGIIANISKKRMVF
jgi:rod shape determining protein RodA